MTLLLASPRRRLWTVAVLVGVVVLAALSLAIGVRLAAALTTGAVGAGLLFAHPEWCAPLLAAMVVSRLSDVLIETTSAPSVFQPAVGLVTAAVVVSAALNRRMPRGLGVPLVLLGAYLAVVLAATFGAREPAAASRALSEFLRNGAVVLLIIAIIDSARTLAAAVWAFLLVGGLLASLGVWQFLTGSYTQQFHGFAQARDQNIAGAASGYRISGPLPDPNYWAQLLVVIAVFAIGRALSPGRRAPRLLAACLFVVSTIAVVGTFSRGGLVALVLGVAFALWQRRPKVSTLAAVLASVIAGIAVLPSSLQERVLAVAPFLPQSGSTGAVDPSLAGRLSAQLAGWHMFLDHPVLGVGVEQFTYYYYDYTRGLGVDTTLNGLPAHNLYLEVLAQAGLVGAAVLVSVIAVSLWRLNATRARLRLRGHNGSADLVGDVRAALVSYLIAAVFIHAAYPRPMWFLFALAFSVPQLLSGPVAARAPHYGVGAAVEATSGLAAVAVQPTGGPP
jgi:putative inorganic carbon (HCO3(-)) transporter